ncbi:thiolase [Amorphoplanes digitatis]|uniref:Acetyl-CoA acetyltransferase n=1 Tax=Actinoplanes digitatis TaxID=1868 RepID=A0A7W7MPI2_9ACTN|nr:thiolase [Actinoplanes digitatis]MBB4761722.1 acetyl-CoA acetyltransferase [Actinoplanes digitatis]GID90832.1 thiolase [Actinoplanes digitatis]
MTVAVVGAAECDLGLTGKSVLELQSQAVTRALADAGVALSEVDGLATNGISRFSATQLADWLGIRPAWCDSTFAGGAVFEMYVARAAQAIAAGQCTTVVISYASNQRSARSRTLAGIVEEGTPEAVFEAPFRPLYPISYYAMVAQRYLHTYGLGHEALASVAVAARERALRNPAAWTYGKGPLTIDDVLAAPMISTPLGRHDCCLVTDGGGAIVLTSAARARDLPGRPVTVLGYGESLTHTGMATAPDLLRTGAVDSGRRAFARAGLTPAGIDVIQLYDAFTISVPLGLEALGFAAPGEGLHARIPHNTGGGGLAYCHPGQLGVLLLVEAVRQLRGECGERQVPGARTALVHGTGGIFSSHATVILGVDR